MKLPAIVFLLGASAAMLAAQARYAEQYRPQFHFTPEKNWMNDPNGLVFYQGEYHLFYQYNPFGNTWGHMSWGHAVSRDLLHWQHLPVALPEENGVMIFSGSAVVDRTNTSGLCRSADPRDASCLVAIYTGHTATRQTQNIASSNDRGRTWTKYPGNPVIDLGMKDFRDPKVIWFEPAGKWVMVAALPTEKKVRFFGSPDLKRWTALGDFGPAGATSGLWECPDLFPLAVEGPEGGSRWVLVVSVNPGGPSGGSATQYFTGRFDGARFEPDNPGGPPLWVDYGKDFYAMQSYSGIPAADGRRIAIGWFSNWEYAGKEPTNPWRTAQSLPRALTLSRAGGEFRLAQRPVAELERLRAASYQLPGHDAAALNRAVAARSVRGETLEILFDLHPHDAAEAGLKLRKGDREETVVGWQRGPSRAFVDRTRSGATSFHAGFAARHTAPLGASRTGVQLHVFVDRSSVEVFVNDGEAVISERIFPSPGSDGLEFYSLGGQAEFGPVRIWKLRPVWTP